MEKPDVFTFSDYRDFLKAYADLRKETSEYFSFGGWARKLGLKSVSTLTMIVKKQRHMGAKLVPRFIDYFEFTEEEKNYFCELVRINKIEKKGPGLTAFLLEKEKKKYVQRQLFSKWQSYALRELTQLTDFVFDEEYAFHRLNEKINKDEIKKIYKELKDEGIIDSKNMATKKVIAPVEAPSKEEIKLYHKELMELSAEAVHIGLEKRALHATTLSLRTEDIPRAKELIRQFQVMFSQKIENNPGDEVYQLNIQFFPLTKSGSDK